MSQQTQRATPRALLAAFAAAALLVLPSVDAANKARDSTYTEDERSSRDLKNCRTFHSGPSATLDLCELKMDDYISEEARVANVRLYVKNTGTVGVCNIALWIDGMATDALVDYWPKWIDVIPNEGYLAPNKGFELGANVFLKKGFPDHYLVAGFRECNPPDYAATGYEFCKTLGGGEDGDGVLLTWCEDKRYDSWMDSDGSRVMHAQGRVANNGTVDVCSLKFTVDRLGQASDVWPKWFPSMTAKNSPAPLRIGDVMVVGADVPSAGFQRPAVTLVSYGLCDDKGTGNGNDGAAGRSQTLSDGPEDTTTASSMASPSANGSANGHVRRLTSVQRERGALRRHM